MTTREQRARRRLGRHLVDGAHMRSSPPVEGLWNGTFNLRWWQYVEHEHEMGPPDEDVARPNKSRVSV